MFTKLAPVRKSGVAIEKATTSAKSMTSAPPRPPAKVTVFATVFLVLTIVSATYSSGRRDALVGQPAHEPENFLLRPDIYAARRVVQDQHLRLGAGPPGKHHLLLVAA